MSLRQSRLEDHWRHIYQGVYPTRLVELRVSNLSCLEESSTQFSGPITGIIGGNGVGKSTLLGAIAELLTNADTEISPDNTARLSGSTNVARAFANNTEVVLTARNDDTGKRIVEGGRFEGQVRWIDPAGLGLKVTSQLHVEQNLSGLLESVTPVRLDARELSIASYLVGKEYASFEIFEVSDYGGLERFPYFRVSSGPITYGTERMGRGELSLLLTYWTVRDIPRLGVIVLEEPETHVSPRSQDQLMNILAKISDERKVWFIISSHSPAIIRHIPPQHIKLIVQSNQTSGILKTAKPLQVAMILGGGVAFRGAFLVEDSGAAMFLTFLLEIYASGIMREFEIVVASSESGVTRAVDGMPRTKNWLSLVGVYDGDMRGKVALPKPWPIVFLPGSTAPESLIREFLRSIPADRLAETLGCGRDDIAFAWNHVAGVDHHEIMPEFASAVGMDVRSLVRAAVRLWADANNTEAQQFVNRLRDAIDSSMGTG